MLANCSRFLWGYFRRQCNEYCANSSLNCVNYMHSRNCKLARYFWMLVWWTSFIMAMSVIDILFEQYKTKPLLTSYVLRQVDKPVQFPSVFLCPKDAIHHQRLEQYVQRSALPMPPHHLKKCIWNYLHFTHGYELNSTECQGLELSWPRLHQLYLRADEILENCTFAQYEFACGVYFILELTELGPCFIFNNFLILNGARKQSVMAAMEMHILKEYQEEWDVSFGLSSKMHGARFYLRHSFRWLTFEDQPDYVHDETQFNGFQFKIVNFDASPAVKKLSLSQRKCLFLEEMPEELKPYSRVIIYDPSLCTNLFHAFEFVNKCNCLPKWYDKLFQGINASICNITSSLCVNLHRNEIAVNDYETCLPSCIFIEFDRVAVSYRTGISGNFSIGLNSWPVLSAETTVIFGTMDLLLSYGGILGLFTGISLYTSIEFIYYLCVNFFSFFRKNKAKLQQEIHDAIENPNKVDLSLWPRPRPPIWPAKKSINATARPSW